MLLQDHQFLWQEFVIKNQHQKVVYNESVVENHGLLGKNHINFPKPKPNQVPWRLKGSAAVRLIIVVLAGPKDPLR